jgi:FAD/FMN-containing dehydrogenase
MAARDGGETLTISAASLTRIEDYEPEDLTITVGAGVTLAELQQTLSANRQWLALDPPALPEATIGGLVATAAAGPLRAKYGTPRDHVLGLDIATGDGRALRFGGQVVKNVAGYDMVRPMVGSHGTLGLITRVSLRLRPMPEVIRTLAIPVTLENGPSLAWAVENLWPIASLELINPALATRIIPGTGSADPGACFLLIRIDGYEAEVDDAQRRISGSADGVIEVPIEAWQALSHAEATAPVSVRFAALPSRLDQTIKIAKQWSDLMLHHSSDTALAIHAATGIVRVWRARPPGLPDTEAAEAMRMAADSMERLGGTVRTVAGLQAPAYNGTARVRELNRGIKSLFDPAGILPDPAV